nr:reverse transcriptase domain-containing protein [Tanacetum cinerariifolium]
MQIKGLIFEVTQGTVRGAHRFTPLTRTPKEILVAEANKFQPPPPMVTPVEKRNSNKFCDFHNDKGHSTDECMQLKKQIEDDYITDGFSGETTWPLGQLRLLVTIGDVTHSTKAWMNFMIVKSLSPYNGIIGRPGLKAIQAVPSTVHGLLKFPTKEGIVTIPSSLLIPAECASIDTSSATPREKKTRPTNLTVTLHPNFPDQEVVVGGSLSDKGRTELCAILKKNLDIFAWQPSDMTGVPQSIAEHIINIREICPPDCYHLPEIDWKVESLCGYPFKCFLDAYKGYHQIQLAAADEEKTAFHTRQGVYCYTKMPFGLKNAGATYQRLMDKAFETQMGRNIEVYVDDLVVKSHTETKMVRDIEETFPTLRKINMKLNPKKCSFGLAKGVFLGYVITPEGIKPCPDKTTAILQLSSPQTIKEVQSLNGKLASLNRFLFKSAEKYLPLFQTLKKCIKKSDFRWTAKAEQAFQQLKQHLSNLPLLAAPKLQEELIMYLSATHGAISTVLMTERGTAQTPVHFISRTLQGVSVGVTQEEPWTLFTDGSSCVDGSSAGLILTNPEGVEFTYALRFQFGASNNEAEYEALIAGLRIATQMGVKNVQANVDSKLVLVEVLETKSITGNEVTAVIEEEGPTWMTELVNYLKEGILPGDEKEARKLRLKARQYELMEGVLYKRSFLTPWLRCVGPLQAEYVMKEIHKGSCSMHAGPWSVVAKAIRLGYFYPTMHRDAQDMIRRCNDCQIHHPALSGRAGEGQVPDSRNGLLHKVDRSKGGGNDYRRTDNGKQFTDNPFKDWCDKLNITQRFASVKYSQSNGLVERANRSLGEVIPAEIEMPTYRTTAVDVVNNDEELRLNLDLLEERRELAAMSEAKSKSKMMKYYNSRVHGVAFKPGDFVYRSNDASHTVAGGKLGPKWEGPYEVTDALENGAYKLRTDKTLLGLASLAMSSFNKT